MTNEEYITFLDLIAFCVHPTERVPLVLDDYQYVFYEMQNQAIAPLVVGAIGPNCFADHSATAISMFFGNLKLYHEILQEQDRLTELLTRNGISFSYLKGIAAAQYYCCPERRTMGDIDLIIDRNSFERATRLFEDSGYRIIETLEENNRHIQIVGANGIVIEPHIRFSSSNNMRQNEILDSVIDNGLKNRKMITISNHSLFVLPELENGIVLISHINQHLSSGLGLRQIIDWMYYVENVLTDEFWESSFSSLVSKIGMVRLAKIATCMCKKYLKMNSD